MSQNFGNDDPNRFSTRADGVTPAQGNDPWTTPANDPWSVPSANPAPAEPPTYPTYDPQPAPEAERYQPGPTQGYSELPGSLYDRPAYEQPPTASQFPSYDASANYTAGYYAEPSAPRYQPMMYQPMPTQATSPMAMTSLIMTISTVFCGITAPFALGFGIAGYRQVRDYPDRYTGKGMAIAGIAVGGALTALWVLYFVVIVLAAALG